MLFISRDTCSDSIAKLFRASLYGVWVLHRCACVKLSTRGLSHHFGERHRAIWGIAAIVSQYRALVPLSLAIASASYPKDPAVLKILRRSNLLSP